MSSKDEAKDYDAIITKISQKIKEIHYDEETGGKIVVFLNSQIGNERYLKVKTIARFCEELTKDLQTFTHDLHLSVYYDPEEAEKYSSQPDEQDDDRYSVDWWFGVQVPNFGIPKLEYLMGNVGYIKIIYFAPVPIAGDMVITAMNFLSTADALIFDLRECSGGDPYNVMMFESYFFDAYNVPKLLLTRQCRIETPPQQQFWTYPYMPGKRLPDVPVAILTSTCTFSGGEDMAYTLKHHDRAVIVGEKTPGGAHMVKRVSVGNGCILRIPYAHPVHPLTGTDWEGTGVLPDIEVSREEALAAAHQELLSRLKLTAEDEQEKYKYDWLLQRVDSLYHPPSIAEEVLQRYPGVYQGWQVKLEKRRLFLVSPNRLHRDEMIPLSENLFIADEGYNARFRIGENGLADALVWIGRDNDREIVYEKSV
jgi:hypothetical protein